MKILFFTKSKPYTLKTLQELLLQGHQVTVVCKTYASFQNSDMHLWCKKNKIQVWENEELYTDKAIELIKQFDLGISNTYGKLIKKPIIDALNGRIFNVHTAPLPEYKGMFGYNWGIYNREEEWAVTAHYVNEMFDEGAIIKVKKFPIDAEHILVKELEELSQKLAYELTMELVNAFTDGKQPLGYKQEQEGKYYSKKDFETLKIITKEDSPEEIKRKIHACWCPPYEGAYVCKGEEKIFLVTTEILSKIK